MTDQPASSAAPDSDLDDLDVFFACSCGAIRPEDWLSSDPTVSAASEPADVRTLVSILERCLASHANADRARRSTRNLLGKLGRVEWLNEDEHRVRMAYAKGLLP